MQDANKQSTSYPQADIPRYTLDDARKVIEAYTIQPTSYKHTCQQLGYDYRGIWLVIVKQPVKTDSPESLYGLYQHARERKADLIADECMDISDIEDSDPRHNTNRIKSRQWLASCYNRKTYGNAIKVDSEGAIITEL